MTSAITSHESLFARVVYFQFFWSLLSLFPPRGFAMSFLHLARWAIRFRRRMCDHRRSLSARRRSFEPWQSGTIDERVSCGWSRNEPLICWVGREFASEVRSTSRKSCSRSSFSMSCRSDRSGCCTSLNRSWNCGTSSSPHEIGNNFIEACRVDWI